MGTDSVNTPVNTRNTRYTTFSGESLLNGKPINLHVGDGKETAEVGEQLATRSASTGIVTEDELREQYEKYRKLTSTDV